MRRQPYLNIENNLCSESNAQQAEFHSYNRRADSIPHPKHLNLPQSLQPHMRKKNTGFMRPTSPWNHTYTEIHEGRLHRGLVLEDDPVYEEIERNNDMQVSDMSDEDGKRQSDMSRQSSRSYGDHRPLIPYSPATDRSIQSSLEAVSKPHTKEHNRYATDKEQYRMIRQYRGDTVRSLAAVLNGDTVVCHLDPQERYPHDPYTARTLVMPQYSES